MNANNEGIHLMDLRTIDLTRSADLIVGELLAVKANEQVAVVCDPYSDVRATTALAGAVESRGAEYTIMYMPTRGDQRKNELPPTIARGLEAADCLIGLTGSCGAPTYSDVVKDLLDRRKLRVISMVMRDIDIFTRGGALADYRALYDDGKKLDRLMRAEGTVRVTTPAGTDVTTELAREDVIIECGYAHEPGMEAAFSDGEVSCRPAAGTTNGLIVVDGPIAHIGRSQDPIRLTVEDGHVVDVSGVGPHAGRLAEIVRSVENADSIAEFGLGLNPSCLRNGMFEEEKKARGLVHIALGDDIFYGGVTKSPVHMDMVLYSPTVTLGSRVVVEDGNVRLAEPA